MGRKKEKTQEIETWRQKILRLYEVDRMDKKMHKITKRMKTAEKDIRENRKKDAVKTLKKAEMKNEKLVKIDRDVRDPMIKKYKKMKAKGC